MREICQGVNVDPGEAANLRALWRMDGKPSPVGQIAKPLILKMHLNHGDALVMTAAIYSLHRSHPGRFLTAADTGSNDLFYGNPDVIQIDLARKLGATELQMHYPAIHQSNERGIHFMQAMCEHVGEALGIYVPLMTNRPCIYLRDGEKMKTVRPMWLVNAGYTDQFSAKWWGSENYQSVVTSLAGKITFIQVGDKSDTHPRLNGVIDMRGETNLRQLAALVESSAGVLCGLTLLMHMAAAFEKPAVIVAGGREPGQWNAYPYQHLLHTVGNLDCCKSAPCWKSTVNGDNHCTNVSAGLPMCMRKITPQEVADKILFCS